MEAAFSSVALQPGRQDAANPLVQAHHNKMPNDEVVVTGGGGSVSKRSVWFRSFVQGTDDKNASENAVLELSSDGENLQFHASDC
jgi:hypothetical protein